MDGVALLDRMDRKYLFAAAQLPDVLLSLQSDYRVLDIKNVRSSRYESLYFDKPDFELYYAHHRGRVNRYKVRYRRYVDSDIVFIEVKLKNQHGRTIKTRMSCDAIEKKIRDGAAMFVNAHTPFIAEELEPKLWVHYERITLVCKSGIERVTLDRKLSFKNATHEKSITNAVIAEVKKSNRDKSLFANVMRDRHIREERMSKYCFGIGTLYPVKHNNFNLKFRHINQLTHEHPLTSAA